MTNSKIANLREARVRIGFSQKEVADKIGVTQAAVSNWESGRAEPRREQREALFKLLGIGDSRALSSGASPVAAWLTKVRVQKGLSVPELAERAGLTPPALYRIEAGKTLNLRASTRSALEKALGTSLPDETAKEAEEDARVVGVGTLEDFDPHEESELPHEPGVYVLYDISDRPIYVGEGSDVGKRIKDHEQKFWFKRPIVDSASWIQINGQSLRRQVESLLIKFLKSNAVLNKQQVER